MVLSQIVSFVSECVSPTDHSGSEDESEKHTKGVIIISINVKCIAVITIGKEDEQLDSQPEKKN